MTHSQRTALSGLMAFFTATPMVFGWGTQGHRTVALVAQGIISPATAQAINDLTGGLQLTDLATCPDEIRVAQSTTSPNCRKVFPAKNPASEPWHFINLDVSTPSPNNTAEDQICASNCVVSKIVEFAAKVGDKTASKSDRLQALSYLVHFVGDVHQPLHAAERNKDEGGNKVFVKLNRKQVKLHAAWDTGIVLLIGPNESAIASAIAPEIATAKLETPKAASDWAHDWARESLTDAINAAYKGVPPTPVTTLDANYQAAAKTLIRTQLAKGGYRLAVLLDNAFAGK